MSFGGLVEIVPLMFQAKSRSSRCRASSPIRRWQLDGRDVYVREGCYNCHSQMMRTLRFETERYGHYSLAGESVYDHPFQWGSKRTGPDLARVGGRYSDDWHRAHLRQSARRRARVEHAGVSVAGENTLEGDDIAPQDARAAAHRRSVHRRRDRGRRRSVEGKTELDAVIAYLQNLGLALRNVKN